ncbi:hypothetical protein TST_1235 [Thermosulfidibacter takaii ABI70S6]|uniref:PilZ domain-containing protein n=1 Tax=Thermosulfidibacter takaii (strain DSM 17441 / JCM 13301 / NBRC 103674 / ABI70S6) TaxID=1298851 RepID=A0A0S3QUL5_THET7|nr:PilZ domain-containing protein [Thermosulfidibacter takaii]BAT72022.1 hypothetical protein TST_1235 [Thermosulfidibacter takaii ABI70S6]
MKSDTGKRSYVRVPVAVRVAFSVVDPSQRENLIKAIEGQQASEYEDVASYSRLIMEKHKLQEVKEVNPLILELLVYLKKKLEAVEEQLKGECDICYEYKTYTLDLGGGGFSALVNKELKPGTLIDVFLDVPLFPKPGIKAIGKVVSCERQDQEYVIRVAFDFIREDDREDLIKFVFIKQREILARRSLER